MGNLLNGFFSILDPVVIILMCAGVLIGIIIGSLPGLTDPMALGLAVPFTFGMQPIAAILFLLGLHFGALYGGSITAILINTPGTPAGAAAALDGYPLTKKGNSKKALQMSAVAAFFGAMISVASLIIFSPLIAKIALQFGPSEYFALGIFGLSVVAGIAGNSLNKALIAASLGVFLSLIGTDPLYGAERFTFGSNFLYAGIDLVTALIGLFAVSELLKIFYAKDVEKKEAGGAVIGKGITLKDLKNALKTMFKGGGIGTLVGALPGTGAIISSFLSYGEEVRSSKYPEKYGKGELNGVAAAESGAVGTESAAMIPLLTLGIPGDVATAILLGAFKLHDVKIGPDLFSESGDIVYAMFIGIIILEIIVLITGWYGSNIIAKVVKIKNKYLYPIILVLVVAGTFALMNDLFNVWVALAIGLVGFLMVRFDYPLPPLLLGLILGPIVEENFLLAMSSTDGDVIEFLTRPLTAAILILALITTFFSIKIQQQTQKQIKKV